MCNSSNFPNVWSNMTSFAQVFSICAIFIPLFIPTVLSQTTSTTPTTDSHTTKENGDASKVASLILGDLGFNDELTKIIAGFETALGATFGDESPIRNFEDLLSKLDTDRSGKEYGEFVAFNDVVLGLPREEFTKSGSGVETINGVKVRTNASVQWSPDDDNKNGGTLLGLIKSYVDGDNGGKVCVTKSDCDDNQFCPPFVLGLPKHCTKCLAEGGICSSNDQCCDETVLCAWGQCKKGVQAGESGTRCTSNQDCLAQHCCALVDGRHVCKPYSTEGSVCTDYQKSFFNTLLGVNKQPAVSCPCLEGLFCRSVKGAVSVLDSITGEKICVPSAADAEEEAVEKMAEDVLSGVFDKVAKEIGNEVDDVVKKEGDKKE